MHPVICVLCALFLALHHVTARFLTEAEHTYLLHSDSTRGDRELREALEEKRVLEGFECNDWKDDPGDPGNKEGGSRDTGDDKDHNRRLILTKEAGQQMQFWHVHGRRWKL
jgi:hypothetical protein